MREVRALSPPNLEQPEAEYGDLASLLSHGGSSPFIILEDTLDTLRSSWEKMLQEQGKHLKTKLRDLLIQG